MTIARVSCILLAYSFGIEGLFPFRYATNTEEDSQKTARGPRPWFSQDGDMSFVNIEMDGANGLDDKTTFSLKKSPGSLNIKLDKKKNSEEAFMKLKGVLDGIGEVVR